MLNIKVGESVNEYFGHTLVVVNKLRANKGMMDDVTVIEKILISMTPKFNYVVCSIEESNDLDALTIDELQSSLLVHEQRMKAHVVEEQALENQMQLLEMEMKLKLMNIAVLRKVKLMARMGQMKAIHLAQVKILHLNLVD
ncbi:hypothetical protein F0562_002974 [Nyssa sinensis]|uniref:Retrovirus-related Pol polyprotein from transposon TNT 1-94 n=1 Tax=Nyssa sinensis TaxID=561372 RepID=A0A5J5BX62_9ASTE|nr:hypothetical protein F0562_002974 [Nyssa sinensis]